MSDLPELELKTVSQLCVSVVMTMDKTEPAWFKFFSEASYCPHFSDSPISSSPKSKGNTCSEKSEKDHSLHT